MAHSSMFHFLTFLLSLLLKYSVTSIIPENAADVDKCVNGCGIVEDVYPGPDTPDSPMFRSIGSVNAPPYQFPSVALIEFSVKCGHGSLQPYKHRCTGFVVDPEGIVSAAHCFYANLTTVHRHCQLDMDEVSRTAWLKIRPDNVQIKVGLTDVDKPGEGAQEITGVSRLIVPSDFEPDQIRERISTRDFGLLKLKEAIRFSHWIRPICLPERLSSDFESGQVASWGQNQTENGETLVARKLQEVTLPIQNAAECQKRPKLKEYGFDAAVHLCAGFRARGLTKGDSGSALMVKRNDRYFAIGVFVTATTTSMIRSAMPDVFIRSPTLCSFLKDNLKKEVCIDMSKRDDVCNRILENRRTEQISKACAHREGMCPFSLSAPAGSTFGPHSTSNNRGNMKGSANTPQSDEQRAEVDAKEIYKSMEGFGTTEETLIEIITTRTNAELRAIKQTYEKLYNHSLQEDIESETSGVFKTLLIDLLDADRDETSHTDPEKAAQDARTLFKVGEEIYGTDSVQFVNALGNQNLLQLGLMFGEYENIAGHSFETGLENEFSGDELAAFQQIAANVRNHGPRTQN